jgi:hypothetical protein
VYVVFMMFSVSKIAWAGKCFGFKQWQLTSKGNSFSRGLGGESQVCDILLEVEGGQTCNEM